MNLPAMTGNIYLANSPDALEDIDILDNSSFAPAAKLPRWFPPLRNSYDARESLYQGLSSFYIALDIGTEGQLSRPHRDFVNEAGSRDGKYIRTDFLKA